ncbi:MAG: hypothetical protein ACLPSW_32170 [Roseiarcus sp.]
MQELEPHDPWFGYFNHFPLFPSSKSLGFPPYCAMPTIQRIDGLRSRLYLPALLQGVFGSPGWMAGLLGKSGGLARTPAKVAAARENGRKGGRPRKRASA